MNKLACVYRATSNELIEKRPIRPPYFDKRKCWCSFYDSFKNKADIYVLFDGEKSEFSDYIEQFEGVNLQFLYCRSNKGSLLASYNWARQLKNEFLNFQEDDYISLPNACDVLLEGLELSKDKKLIVTVFDHADRYKEGNNDVTWGQDHILLTKSKHWRTCESTCGSIAMIRPYFNDLYDLLVKFNEEGENAAKDREFYRSILKLGFRLISCLPACSSHMVISDMSPIIDWENFSNNIYV